MTIQLTELIVSQAKTAAVMFCAGILVESLWQLKDCLQRMDPGRGLWVLEEILFWAASGTALSAFLYYCAYGRISIHACTGFFIGLLLWKKLWHCVMMGSWVKDDEAHNLKTTAKSSTWRRQGGSGRKKGMLRKRGKRKKNDTPQAREQEGRWRSDEAGTGSG